MSALFFRPLPFSTIWGGTAIKEFFGYEWMADDTGNAWAFSAQPNGSNACLTAPYEGRTLAELWEGEPSLFGGEKVTAGRAFPVIVSLMCPCADLSIQVHPDDAHAAALGLPYGKNESWYFLGAEPGARIVLGHNAACEEELRELIAAGRWDDLIRHVAVRTGDFVYLEAGTLHACCKNVIAYEVQRACDVTYRFYDYDRRDASGERRELQLEEAIGTLSYEGRLNRVAYAARVEAQGCWKRTCFHDGADYRFERLDVTGGSYALDGSAYQLVSVVEGAGEVDGAPVGVGDNFLAPAGERVQVAGDLVCMLTTA